MHIKRCIYPKKEMNKFKQRIRMDNWKINELQNAFNETESLNS